MQCEHCGQAKPFHWLGGYHNCQPHSQGYRAYLDWYQFDMAGLWPSDWPESSRRRHGGW